MPKYLKPCPVTHDTSRRELDAAGKLKVQTARSDLKQTNFVDPNRRVEFETPK